MHSPIIAWSGISPIARANLKKNTTDTYTEQFVQFYFKTFDENRAGLASLYVGGQRGTLYNTSSLMRSPEGHFYAHL